MIALSPMLDEIVLALFIAVQIAYACTFLLEIYFFTRPVNWVRQPAPRALDTAPLPFIVLFYPVLKELETTMETTFLSLSRLDYPRDRFAVVAIPNANDFETVASLSRLQARFGFLRVLSVPPTNDPAWNPVWDNWSATKKAYWWHQGYRAGNKALPPKKTRQLIFGFYTVAKEREGQGDFLVNYIDADSCPPADHFMAAAAGIRDYDVLQAQNIAGNLNGSLAASWHAFDHMAWDGSKYPHLSADGKHPFWVLGKGLFFKASDLLELGGFHPWLTIEDPEVGMRFWTNGRRLGIIENPLIEEVPETFSHGITQRKRWVAGFFQSLGTPLSDMGMRPIDRFKAWLNFLPCMSLWLNALGFPLAVWATTGFLRGTLDIPGWLSLLCVANLSFFVASLAMLYLRTWRRTALVLKTRRQRAWYLLRVNPLFLMAWWVMWLIPLWIGFRMYLKDEGLVWERTIKNDANHGLVRARLRGGERVAGAARLAKGNIVSFPLPANETLQPLTKGISNG